MVVVVESARTQANIPNVRGSEDGFEFFAGRGVGAGAADGHAAALAGIPDPARATVWSLERFGAFNHAVLQANQVGSPDSLLALRVNGVDLSPDHGYPARIIVPALPGVHNTKWVRSIEFGRR